MVSYNRRCSYLTFSALDGGVCAPRPKVFSEVHERRASAWMDHRSSRVKAETLALPSDCCFCENLNPPESHEVCVVRGSPSTNVKLPLNPRLSPVEGLEPI